jgi:hypothetical protein
MTTTPAINRTAEERGEWLAVHIYYAASPRPMLLTCIRPLIDELTREGLLAGHFFVNYWLEGPHVRLRLRPARPSAAAEVQRRTEEAISAFLRRRPALYQVEESFLDDLYGAFLVLELHDEERRAYTGPDGRMRLRPNNSYAVLPYEPEYAKYGGPAGVELAEWHFEHSSDLVLEAMRTLNLHVRTVNLGFATQLATVMASVFLPDREELEAFFRHYHQFWRRTFADTELVGPEDYGPRYDVTPALVERVALVRDAVASDAQGQLPEILERWAGHSRELHCRIGDLVAERRLVFPSWTGGGDEPAIDVAAATQRLLLPYLHMTNNRLHVTIRDEAYLSSLLAKALSAGALQRAEVTS